MTDSASTEDVSVLTHLDLTTTITRSPLYGVYSASDPSSFPEKITPIDMKAPDGSPLTADEISLQVSTQNSDGTYSNVSETVTPEQVLAGHLAQLPTPSPSTNLSYNFYSYQTIAADPTPTSDLGESEQSFLAGIQDTVLDHSHSVAAFARYIRQNLSSFEAAADEASQNPQIEEEAAALGDVSPRKFLQGGVLAGVGGAVLTETAELGAALSIGTFGATALGVAMVAGGLYKAYDALNGTDHFDHLIQNATSVLRTGIRLDR